MLIFSVHNARLQQCQTVHIPFERYMFKKKLSFGLSSAQDMFHDIMSGLFEVVVDDVPIWGETKERDDTRRSTEMCSTLRPQNKQKQSSAKERLQ